MKFSGDTFGWDFGDTFGWDFGWLKNLLKIRIKLFWGGKKNGGEWGIELFFGEKLTKMMVL